MQHILRVVGARVCSSRNSLLGLLFTILLILDAFTQTWEILNVSSLTKSRSRIVSSSHGLNEGMVHIALSNLKSRVNKD